MQSKIYGGSFALFAVFTVALIINLTQLQSGTRGLKPAPVVSTATAASADGMDQASREQIVILNAERAKKTAAAVQSELGLLGYQPGGSDGAVNLMTRAAVMAFEYDNGLPLTARADEAQLQRLVGMAGIGSRTQANAGLPTTDEAKLVMRTVQQSLTQLNYEPGPIDGTYSAATERAIRNFEIDSRLPETGRISGRLIAAIAGQADRGKLAFDRR